MEVPRIRIGNQTSCQVPSQVRTIRVAAWIRCLRVVQRPGAVRMVRGRHGRRRAEGVARRCG